MIITILCVRMNNGYCRSGVQEVMCGECRRRKGGALSSSSKLSCVVRQVSSRGLFPTTTNSSSTSPSSRCSCSHLRRRTSRTLKSRRATQVACVLPTSTSSGTVLHQHRLFCFPALPTLVVMLMCVPFLSSEPNVVACLGTRMDCVTNH